MKTFPVFLIGLVVAAWIGAIAILSVQNATPVSLNFLVFQSIQMPVGVVLGLSVGTGLVGGALLQSLARLSDGSSESRPLETGTENRYGSYSSENEGDW